MGIRSAKAWNSDLPHDDGQKEEAVDGLTKRRIPAKKNKVDRIPRQGHDCRKGKVKSTGRDARKTLSGKKNI